MEIIEDTSTWNTCPRMHPYAGFTLLSCRLCNYRRHFKAYQLPSVPSVPMPDVRDPPCYTVHKVAVQPISLLVTLRWQRYHGFGTDGSVPGVHPDRQKAPCAP